MKLVTDSGADLFFPAEVLQTLNVEVVPLQVTLDDKTYRDGIDIQSEQFYDLLAQSDSLPITSQPSAGEFARVYRRLAQEDPNILSIHISSGLSGTYNSAVAGAEMVPEANVIHFDAKTLSAVVGWMVEAAARAIKANLPPERILALLERIRAASDSIYTLNELKYLINGGRISHIKGLLASMLNIKPLIGVEKLNGTYIQLGQERTFKKAVDGLVKHIAKSYPLGSALRVQVLSARNPEGVALLHEKIDAAFQCHWLPVGSLSPVLGAHTGPSMVGVAYAPQYVFAEIP